MRITNDEILSMPRLRRLNIINSVSGIKPANLIGTISDEGVTNLAVFSSIVHIGSNPPLLAFIMRPSKEVRRHTYENILANGYYTINHIHESFIQKAHYTAAKFPPEVSEFEKCELQEEYLHDFKAPFVAESQLKMGMKHVESIPIPINGTVMVIGEIQELILPKESMNEEGHINLSSINDVGISGLNTYYSLTKMEEFPFARPTELPNFK